VCALSDEDKYGRIVHITIIVLGILTCGTSVLLWWLYSGLTKHCCKQDSEGIYMHTYVHIHAYVSIFILFLHIESAMPLSIKVSPSETYGLNICTYIYVHTRKVLKDEI